MIKTCELCDFFKKEKGLHLLLSVIAVQYKLLYCRDITTYAYNVQKC